MANKIISKISINKELFMSVLKIQGKSIRGLGDDPDFNWSAKSIERGLNSGSVSVQLMTDICNYLGFNYGYFSNNIVEANDVKSEFTEKEIEVLKIALSAAEYGDCISDYPDYSEYEETFEHLKTLFNKNNTQ